MAIWDLYLRNYCWIIFIILLVSRLDDVMNTQTQEALKMAIANIGWADHLHDWHDGLYEALNACKKALEPDRTGMVYYKNNACKAKDAKSPDCICWTPKQSAQEPVEVYGILDDGDYVSVEATKEGAIKQCDFMNKHDCNCTYKPLYTHPHQWQGLSDDEISKVIIDEQIPVRTGKTANRFARAIEQALKEKNT